jgi:hypothetical protein
MHVSKKPKIKIVELRNNRQNCEELTANTSGEAKGADFAGVSFLEGVFLAGVAPFLAEVTFFKGLSNSKFTVPLEACNRKFMLKLIFLLNIQLF